MLFFRKFNSIAISTLAFLFGAISQFGVVIGLSLLLSNTKPEYATYTMTVAETSGIFTIYAFSRFLINSRLKFSLIVTLALVIITICYVLILIGFLQYSNTSLPIITVVWYGFSIFADSMYWFFLLKLTSKYLSPSVAQVQLFKNDSAYGVGMLLTAIIFIPIINKISPIIFLLIIILFCLVSILIITIVLCPKTNIEISFSPTVKLPKAPSKNPSDFKTMTYLFGITIFFIGVAEMLFSYTANTYISLSLITQDKISQTIMIAFFAGGLLQILISSIIAQYQEKYRASPINILLLHCIIIMGGAIACTIFLSFSAFFALLVLLLVGQTALRYSALQMIVSSFTEDIEDWLRNLANICLLTIAGLFTSVFLEIFIHIGVNGYRLVILSLEVGIIVAVLAIAVLLIYRSNLIKVLYKNTIDNSKQAAVLAITALSFLNPKDYVSRMISLWQSHPKKLIHKTIILNVSSRANIIDYLDEEFDSSSEEIQLAALEAVRMYKDFTNLEFIIEVVMGKRMVRSFFVRAEATKILAKFYRKYALPFLMYGLKNGSERTQANILEAFLIIKDYHIIPIVRKYTNNNIPRIRANALMVLASFRSEKEAYHQGILNMLSSNDENLIASSLYVVGKLRDKSFLARVISLQNSEYFTNPMIKRNIAFALSRMHNLQGYQIFCELFSTPYVPGKQEDFIHSFLQLDSMEHFEILDMLYTQYVRSTEKSNNIYLHLKNCRFDFHEEITFLRSLNLDNKKNK